MITNILISLETCFFFFKQFIYKTISIILIGYFFRFIVRFVMIIILNLTFQKERSKEAQNSCNISIVYKPFNLNIHWQINAEKTTILKNIQNQGT